MSFKDKINAKRDELAKKYSDPNNLRHCAVTTPEEDEFTAFASGFAAATDIVLKELASGGEYREWTLVDDIIEDRHGRDKSAITVIGEFLDDNERVKVIEATALSAERAKRIEVEERLKEAEKVILYFSDLGSKRALQYMEKVK